MRFKSNQFVVNPKYPFYGDLLGREETCEIWTKYIEDKFVERPDEPFVLALDSKWGDGKTTFLEMWRAYLAEKEFGTIFFDAWEADFYDEALPALVSEIQKQLKQHKSCVQKIQRMAKKLPKEEVAQVAADIVSPRLGKLVNSILKLKLKEYGRVADYSAYRKVVDEFKEELAKIAEKKPLVIFIDELNRCRPTFALEVLEKVKHIFDVPGVFFVIAVNKDALSKTIQSEYGEIDANLYLERFFNETRILKSNPHMFIKGLIEGMIRSGGYPMLEYYEIIEIFESIIKLLDISLREQKKIVVACVYIIEQERLDILNQWGNSNQWRVVPSILIFFFALKIVNPDLFRKIFKVQVEESDTDLMIFPSDDIKEFLDEKMKPYRHSYPVENKEKYIYVMHAYLYIFVGQLNNRANKLEFSEEFKRNQQIEPHLGHIQKFFEEFASTRSDARRVFDNILTLIEGGNLDPVVGEQVDENDGVER